MALKATIFKADIQIADMDRNYYQNHALTLARHPSETDERMMLRILAFARHANEELQLCKGISDTEEPDLWQKDLTGTIDLWLELGQPDEKRIRKACGRARQVIIYNYGGSVADIWWRQAGEKLKVLDNLTIYAIPYAQSQALAKLAQRTMQLQCTIQEDLIWLADARDSVQVEPVARLKAGAKGR